MNNNTKRQKSMYLSQRDKNCNPFKPISISLLISDNRYKFLKINTITYQIPFYSSTVKAGFPSPADDYIQAHLDLNTYLIKHPSATFFIIAAGDAMIEAGIAKGDLLIVDKSLEATHGKMVIAAIQGELTIKRVFRQNGKIQLLGNKNYKIIDISEEMGSIIWGVVTHVIHHTN